MADPNINVFVDDSEVVPLAHEIEQHTKRLGKIIAQDIALTAGNGQIGGYVRMEQVGDDPLRLYAHPTPLLLKVIDELRRTNLT